MRRRLITRAIAGAALCLFCGLASWLVAPSESAAAAAPPPAPERGEIVYVIAGSWHTEIALPVAEIGGDLTRLAAAFPGAPYLIFGWGARDFYMAKNPGLGDLLRAAVPGPAVMLIIPLGVPPTAYLGPANAWRIAISRVGAAGLAQFIWNSVAKNRAGEPIRAGAGPTPQSAFYTANGTYDAANTCNTWTAAALNAAGLPVSAAGVVFAGQVIERIKDLPDANTTAAAR